jgi:hypothetical protein
MTHPKLVEQQVPLGWRVAISASQSGQSGRHRCTQRQSKVWQGSSVADGTGDCVGNAVANWIQAKRKRRTSIVVVVCCEDPK